MVYECEIKEARGLSDDGVSRPRPQNFSPRFMINKITGVVVGEVFEHDLTWRLIEQGSTSTSFKTAGYRPGGDLYVALTVLEFHSGKEKPFMVFDIGIGSLLTGLCR